MAPAKTSYLPKVGDLVFAKVKGYSFWPARVESFHPLGEGNKIPTGKHSVFFYGTYEMALIGTKEVVPFEENKVKYGKVKSKDFLRAMKEIQETPEITCNPANQSVMSETLSSTVQTKTESGDDDEQPMEEGDTNASALIVDEPSTATPKATKKVATSSAKKKNSATPVTSNKKSKKKQPKMLVKIDFDQKPAVADKTKSKKPQEEEETSEATEETAETPVTQSSTRKRASSNSTSRPPANKRAKKDTKEEQKQPAAPIDEQPTEPIKEEEESVPVVEIQVEEKISEPTEKNVEANDKSGEKIIPKPEDPKNGTKDKQPQEKQKIDELTKESKQKQGKEVKHKKSSKTEHAEQSKSKIKENVKVKPTTNGQEAQKEKKAVFFIEEVGQTEKKIPKEVGPDNFAKLMAKAAEREQEKNEKKLKKLQEKRKKRLEQFKSMPVTTQSLIDIESEIVESLDANNPDIKRCLNAMQKLDYLNVTQSLLSSCPSLLVTIKTCKRFKTDEAVRQKSSYLFNKFKHMFSNGLEEGLLPMSSHEAKKPMQQEPSHNKDDTGSQSSQSPIITSSENNSDVSCSPKTTDNKTPTQLKDKKKPESSVTQKEPITAVTPTRESETTDTPNFTTEAMHDTRENNVNMPASVDETVTAGGDASQVTAESLSSKALEIN